MATAITKPALEKDHVYVEVLRQAEELPPPGTYVWPIGMVYEAVKAGYVRIDKRSSKEFETFQKAIQAREAKETAKREAEQAARENELRGRPLQVTGNNDELHKRHAKLLDEDYAERQARAIS